ncbi:site-specific DNA-methyltransferase [Mycoplasmopsis synoviae]|nr:DNA methyltransferase [Mycoplasmopsis synoviae]AKB11394.1 hypothetical protein VY93_03705 [Mycoplasmopsis synoviae ATCC 25204]
MELHDYVLIYAKNKNIIKLKKEKRDNPKIHKDENGKYQLTSFKNTWFNENNYPIYYDNKNKTFHSKNNSNNDLKEFLGNWIWKKAKFEKNKNKLWMDEKEKIRIKEYKKEFKKKLWPYSTWLDKYEYQNKPGATELSEILNETKFHYVKPLGLMKWMLNLFINKNTRVLDIFGSHDTFAHAIEELNFKDGGNRSYTIISNNENIAKLAIYKRLYRINNGQNWIEKNDPYKSNLDVFNVKYESTDLNDPKDKNEIVDKVIKMFEAFEIDISDKESSRERIVDNLR